MPKSMENRLSGTSIVSSTQSVKSSTSNQEQDQAAIKTSWGQDKVILGSTDSKYMTYSATSVAAVNTAANSSTISQDLSAISSAKAPSIYDMTDKEISETLKKVKQQAKAAVYTGMSDVEIYRAITERYTNAFGADFMDEWQVNIQESTSYGTVACSYENELSNQFGSKTFSVARQANYGDMSSEEITKTIMAKYPPVDQQTYRDTFLMTGEMRWAHVDDGCLHSLISQTADMLYKTHFNSTVTHKTYTSEEQNQFKTQLLDDKLDPSAIAFTYNARKFAGMSMPPATGIMMNRLFGMSLGANGMFPVKFDPKEYFLSSWSPLENTKDNNDVYKKT